MKAAYTLPHHGVIKAICLSPNKKWLATGSADGTIRVGSVDSLDVNSVSRVSFHLESGGVKAMYFSSDAKFLFCLGCDGVLATFKIMLVSGFFWVAVTVFKIILTKTKFFELIVGIQFKRGSLYLTS